MSALQLATETAGLTEKRYWYPLNKRSLLFYKYFQRKKMRMSVLKAMK
ncbi:hypothetical protein D1BOALGB6SA_9676 [Olavius sp. associated proteobacterium Delta 1]|nr:hypothetical protein D1BOALGB6SA_9676 [Olavius sp. associated proteobacterium Delta 1]